MFELAILIGLYSYCLFLFGIFGLLYKEVVWGVTVCFSLLFIIRFRGKVSFSINKNLMPLTVFFILQVLVNLLGALGPELSFDALWYHLTLPKLYLLNNSVFYIPGGLLYYSAMPKLGELLYVGALTIGNEISVKLLHLSFGLLTCLAIYNVARKLFSKAISFLAVIIFYSNLVVAWESTVAYVDLIRTFYETMALWGFINWYKNGDRKWFIYSSVMIGLAIATKLLAVGSLLIFLLLIIYAKYEKGLRKISDVFLKIPLYTIIALLIPLPWIVFAFIHTGNPVYPFFSEIYKITPEPFSLLGFGKDIWNVFMYASDPISPIYMVFLPLLILSFPTFSKEIKIIFFYSLLSVIIWYFTPRTGGGRFLLPYLPAFSILCIAVLSNILKKVRMSSNFLFRFLVFLIMFTAIVSVGYRLAASVKYVPVVFGMESKSEFLSKHLHFTYGDFYDTDNYFSRNIKPTDRVLLYGFHNLYYVNFPYVDSSWIKSGDTFNYVAVQGNVLPSKFDKWQLVYSNAKTMVKLYAPPRGLCKELCVY